MKFFFNVLYKKIEDFLYESSLFVIHEINEKNEFPCEEEKIVMEFFYNEPSSACHKYNSINLEDYVDEFSQLPADANPLNPQLVDPAILNAISDESTS